MRSSFSGDVQDDTVVRVLLGVAGCSDRDNTHGWWPVSSLARSFIRSVVGRSPARSSTLARYLGDSVARSLFRSISRPPRSPLRSTARPLGRSFVRSLGRARARHLALFLPRSIVRSFACLRTLTRSLAGSVSRALVRFRAYVLARVCAIVRSCSVARPLVRSLARSLVRSAARHCGWGIQFSRGPHSEECILKETAARSPVKLLFCWADQPNKKYILRGACALGEWRLGTFPFQESVVIEISMFVHEFKRLLEHAWNHNSGRSTKTRKK